MSEARGGVLVRTDLGTDVPVDPGVGRIGVCSICGGDVAAPKGIVECQACGAVPAPVVIQMQARAVAPGS